MEKSLSGVKRTLKNTLASLLTVAALSAPVYAKDHAVSRNSTLTPAISSIADVSQNLYSRTNEEFMSDVANAFRVKVRNTEETKWGWKVKYLEICPDHYRIIIENEPAPECPTRVLRANLIVNHDGTYTLQREDNHSALVSSRADKDYMELYALKAPEIRINNLKGNDNGPFPDVAATFQSISLQYANLLGLDAKEIVHVESAPDKYEDMDLLSGALRNESDPFGISIIYQIGTEKTKKADEDQRISGLYEADTFHVNPGNLAEMPRVLAATVSMRLDRMPNLVRVDAKSDLNGPYTKTYVWLPKYDDKGFLVEDKKFGVDNKNTPTSGVWWPDVWNAFLTFNYWNPEKR